MEEWRGMKEAVRSGRAEGGLEEDLNLRRRDARELSRAEMCVLALVAEHPAHGWAISRHVEPDGDIGRIWTADRQRVYRAIRTLERRGLLETVGLEPGGGPHRTIYRVTAEGRA